MLGLYVHIPFCSAICNYCNFNRGLFDAGLKARYVEALLTEITDVRGQESTLETEGPRSPSKAWAWGPTQTEECRDTAEQGRPRDKGIKEGADTIYFGGGTPSLLEPGEIARIIAACRASFDVSPTAEITLEANPETVTTEGLARFRAAGINRVSFGVQSFREDELRRLSRLHDASRAHAAIEEARRAGFSNVSLDLMMWLPKQGVAEWLESVDEAIRVAPEHMSLYLLEVYPNAPLKEDMARYQWSQAPDEDASAMYLEGMARLDAAGYEQYEISNVARPGRRSRHNLKYWTDGEWLGFGCGAHSTRGARRWKNVAGTEEYIEHLRRRRSPAIDARTRPEEECLGDALFTGLRLADGVDLAVIHARYGVDVWQRYGSDLEPFVASGLLCRAGSRLWLTRQGMLLAHEVMAVFV